ncbi:MAG: hypothetical protein ACPGUV_11030 [Polyangiales bacterium]
MLCSCAPDAQRAGFEVSGYVVGVDDGKPLAGVEVQLWTDTLRQLRTRTDVAGFYHFEVDADVSFAQLRCQHQALGSQERTLLFDAPLHRIDLRLSVPPAPAGELRAGPP